MRTVIFCAAVSILAAGCEKKLTLEEEWMEKGKAAISSMMKDPGSAQFRSVFFHDSALWSAVTCGEVNGKNSYGAYSGFERFISTGTDYSSSTESTGFDYTLIDPSLTSFDLSKSPC